MKNSEKCYTECMKKCIEETKGHRGLVIIYCDTVCEDKCFE